MASTTSQNGNGRTPFHKLSTDQVQTLINLTDDAHACRHDALPLDRKKPDECRCWTPERTLALSLRREPTPDFAMDD